MLKLIAVVVFSLFYNVQFVVSTKERASNETVQDVSRSVSENVHQGSNEEPSEEFPVLEPHARWNPSVNALP